MTAASGFPAATGLTETGDTKIAYIAVPVPGPVGPSANAAKAQALLDSYVRAEWAAMTALKLALGQLP